MGFFNKNDPPEQSGMFDGILVSLLSRYGVTQTHIDKVKALLDKVEISDKEIKVNLKGATIKIDK
jgi:hypothetical protein